MGDVKMKEKWKQFRLWAIIISICMLVLGVLVLIWPKISAVAVCYILGAFCIGTGIYEIVRYFQLGFAGLLFQHDLIWGIFSILAGILLLIHPLGAAAFLPIVAGIYIVMGSIFDIQMSVEMRGLRIGNWVLSLVLGIIGIIFAFFLILNPFEGITALMVYVGISLILGSIQSLYAVHCISSAVKASRNDNVIDVTWRSMD